MKNFVMVASAVLCAFPALSACRPRGDAARANEAMGRHGGDAAAVTTLSPDTKNSTPLDSTPPGARTPPPANR